METIEKLNRIFCEVFDDKDIVISREMTSDDVDGWDSLSYINLILAVEESFGIDFEETEIKDFENVGTLIDTIENKLK